MDCPTTHVSSRTVVKDEQPDGFLMECDNFSHDNVAPLDMSPSSAAPDPLVISSSGMKEENEQELVKEELNLEPSPTANEDSGLGILCVWDPVLKVHRPQLVADKKCVACNNAYRVVGSTKDELNVGADRCESCTQQLETGHEQEECFPYEEEERKLTVTAAVLTDLDISERNETTDNLKVAVKKEQVSGGNDLKVKKVRKTKRKSQRKKSIADKCLLKETTVLPGTVSRGNDRKDERTRKTDRKTIRNISKDDKFLSKETSVPGKKNSFACSVCKEVFKTRTWLSKHEACHKEYPDGAFKCNKCDKTFIKLKVFHAHQRSHDPNKKKMAQKYYLDHLESITHLKGDDGKVNFACKICDKIETDELRIGRHILYHKVKGHMEGCEPIRMPVCDVCQLVYHGKNVLENHMRKHKGTREFICEFCAKSFWTEFDLRRHRMLHSKEKHICNICNKALPSLYHLKNHLRKSHPKVKKQCEVCGKEVQSKQSLERHMLTHTEREKTVPCSICNKMFRDRSEVLIHNRNCHQKDLFPQKPVSNEKTSYQCATCGKTYCKAYYLKRHQNIHTGQNIHRCVKCDKVFAYAAHLKGHMRTHTGEKFSQCEICFKKFSTNSYLKVHMKLHTGETRYQCDKCDQKFLWSYAWEKHMAHCGAESDT